MAGLRVGVTAGRRGGVLVDALTRLGAGVVWAPTVEVVPTPASTVHRQTEVALDARPAGVVVATAEALHRWVDGAREAHSEVLDLLIASKVAARGAKATGACRQHGVATVLTMPTERGVDLARLVVDLAHTGDHMAVVVDGSGSAPGRGRARVGRPGRPRRRPLPVGHAPGGRPGARPEPRCSGRRTVAGPVRRRTRRHGLHERAGRGRALCRGGLTGGRDRRSTTR